MLVPVRHRPDLLYTHHAGRHLHWTSGTWSHHRHTESCKQNKTKQNLHWASAGVPRRFRSALIQQRPGRYTYVITHLVLMTAALHDMMIDIIDAS